MFVYRAKTIMVKKMKLFYTKRSSKSTTYESLKFSFILGRCFGMFPIEGLMGRELQTLRFRLISWFTIYTVAYMVGVVTVLFFHFYHCIYTSDFNFGYVVSIFFFSCSFLSTGFFLRLCTTWPKLMKIWTKIDEQLQGFDFSKNLPLKLKLISIVVLLAALLEHILCLSSSILNVKHEGWTQFDVFLRRNFNYIFDHIHFSVWKGVFFMMLNFMCTFTWNYTDLFIILMSTSVTSKLKLVNYRLRMSLISKSKNFALWNKLRDEYNSVSNLCKLLDDNISNIVLLSFGNNLFIILVQLFNSLKPHDQGLIGRVYFIYSFIFLISRTTGVLLYASSIHEANREAGIILMSAPSDVYNPVIERLLYKIQADQLALTGKRFFYVTRPLILNIGGAIVTYELVLLQFQLDAY